MSRRFLLVLSSICLLSPICRADVTDPRPIFVEGYAGKVSYKPGEELSLHVSTSASKFAVEITRLGARPEVVFPNRMSLEQSHLSPKMLLPTVASGLQP